MQTDCLCWIGRIAMILMCRILDCPEVQKTIIKWTVLLQWIRDWIIPWDGEGCLIWIGASCRRVGGCVMVRDPVNLFIVDGTGLPILNRSYRNDPYVSDFGLSGSAKDNYKVDRSLAVDPRLDYTVGRRGVPYLDWGIMPGDGWIRDAASAGPFVAQKAMINVADFPGNTASGEPYITALNVNIIRLADVYLMAAESAARTGNLTRAGDLVNAVRERAAMIPHPEVDGEPAAAYDVKPYDEAAFSSESAAMDAIRMERRLELALEGHRFFDLVRWGVAKEVLESYSEFEGELLSLYRNLVFEDKNRYFPIPQAQIDRSSGALKQNPGY